MIVNLWIVIMRSNEEIIKLIECLRDLIMSCNSEYTWRVYGTPASAQLDLLMWLMNNEDLWIDDSLIGESN